MKKVSKKISHSKISEDIKLKFVTKADYHFLYELLEQRNPIVNISHRKMPTYKEHIKFVLSKPYSKWYIIQYNNQKIGSIYLTKQNEIGIFLLNEIVGKGVGSKALELFIMQNPESRYLANINPKNKESIRFFKKFGFKIIQHTYELIKT